MINPIYNKIFLMIDHNGFPQTLVYDEPSRIFVVIKSITVTDKMSVLI